MEQLLDTVFVRIKVLECTTNDDNGGVVFGFWIGNRKIFDFPTI